MNEKRKYNIQGTVSSEHDGRGVPNLRVEAWDKDLLIDDLLGTAETDDNGSFTLNFDETYYQEICVDRKPDIYFKIFSGNRLIHSTEKNVLWNVKRAKNKITIKVPVQGSGIATEVTPGQETIIVKGTINSEIRPLPARMTVQVVNRGVLEDIVLATAAVLRNGRYKVKVTLETTEPPAIVVKGLDQKGDTLAISPPVYELTNPVSIDLYIPAGNIKGEPEYFVILNGIKGLIQDKPVTELSREQLELIAGKTEVSFEHLLLFRRAFEVALSDKISSEILYGLFRMGLPPKLSSLYEQRSFDQRNMIARAVEQNIISLQDEKTIAATLEKLQRHALNNVLNESLMTDGPTFKELIGCSGVSEQAANKFAKAASEHVGSADQLWQDLEKGKYGLKPGEVKKLRFGIQAGSLAMGHLPMVKNIISLKNNQQITGIKDLFKWSKTDWINHLIAAGKEDKEIIPKNVPGKGIKQRRAAYANAMARILEQSYPTESLAAKIDADETSENKSFSVFVENNPTFNIGETNINAYLKENPTALRDIQNKDQFKADLKKLQCLYMLSPGFDRYDSMKILNRMMINSSFDIISKSWKQFNAQYTQNGGSEEMAAIVFRMAAHNMALMQNLQFKYSATSLFGTFVTTIPDFFVFFEDLFEDDPNLATLFGPQDFCQCDHCQSIYSPAAYMVDVLQFLKKAETNESTYSNCLEVLFDRRPDLCDIKLNCINTNTVLPYIDLVNEIFENAVYKNTTGHTPDYTKHQTRGTSEELLSHPEHIREEVYDNALKTAVFPFSLPFDLWTEEGRIYLNHLKLPRYKIMDAFMPEQGAAYLNHVPTVKEILHLSQTDWEIILDTTAETNQELWGLMSGTNIKNTLENADTLLKKTGLDYEDLKELLKTWFINPNGSITLDFDDEERCNLEKAKLKNITVTILMKVLRFIRLKNKLCWSIRELDMALRTFRATTITEPILIKLSHILRLKEFIKLPLYQLLTFWGNIFTGHPHDEENERSPYELLFLNKSVINPVDNAFELVSTLGELADTSRNIGDHSATVKAGLGVSTADLDFLTDPASGVLVDARLNLANLSVLYKHVLLARSLRISLKELVTLINIVGKNPFDPIHTENTIIFVRDYQKIQKSKFRIPDLNYLLQKEYDISLGVGLEEDNIANILIDMRMGLKKIVEENQFSPDPKGEVTTGKLAALLSAEDLDKAISIIEQTPKFTPEEKIAFMVDRFCLYLENSGEAVIRLLEPSTLTDIQSRYEYVLEKVLQYLIKTETREFLKQKIAENLGLDVDVSESLLFKYLKLESGGVDKEVGEVLLTNDYENIEAAIPEQSNAYVLLHKSALILNKFKATSAELDYMFENAFQPSLPGWPGWFAFNELPVTFDGHPSELFVQLLRMCDLFFFYHTLPASEENLFEVMKEAFDPGSESSLDDILEKIAAMAKWEISSLMELGGHIFGFEKSDYQNEIPFIRLKKCMELIKLTSADAAQMNSWTSEGGLNSDSSTQIVHCAKSRYSQEEWLAIARPLRNPLREKQRAALTDWLIHNQSGINTMFELYNYYLIDPEMSACMLTSRIRLALSSIQLFVQRCLMNLEGSVEVTNDDLEHWNQWQWMKTYRLWEANRKVFCYPENWIEPQLRDNKSPFFQELEQDLEQGEVNNENVEKAYVNYLTKLEAVSNIDVLAICNSEKNESGKHGFYVFGRTMGNPQLLYFRKYNYDKTWTCWEKIDIDFEGDHLIPVVYNNKLYIFWPIFTTQTKEVEIDSEQEPEKYREIQMAWSVYINGKWEAKRVTEEKIDELNNYIYCGDKREFEDGVKRFYVGKQINSGNDIVLSVYARHFNHYTDNYFQVGAFTFNPSMKVSVSLTTNKPFIFNLETVFYYIENQEMADVNTWSQPPLIVESITLTEKSPSIPCSVTFNDDFRDLRLIFWTPFLYQDQGHTFLISFDWFKSWKFKLYNHYHPYVSDFMNVIGANGVKGLLNPAFNASDPDALSKKLRRQQVKEEFFTELYGDRVDIVHEDLPVNEVDFSHQGAYSIYNWELFYHIPMMIAEKLSLNQKFEEAQKWYHYIFDPTETSTEYNVPQRFWKLRPFIEIYDRAEDGTPASIVDLMNLLNEGDEEMEVQVDAWRENPFNPHLIARMRISAYQKNVVMKYIDNLLQWADMLFKQDTMETTNEATQLYMLAWYILGEKPRMVEGEKSEERTYCELQEEGIDDFSNALVELETKLTGYFGTKYAAGFNRFKDYLHNPLKNYSDISLFGTSKHWFHSSVPEQPAISRESVQPNRLSLENRIPEGSVGTTYSPVYRTTISHVPSTNTSPLYNMAMNTDLMGSIANSTIAANWDIVGTVYHPGFDLNTVTNILKTLYFCIPYNEKLLGYWDLVADRMFKLRNCMNIEGVVRQLPLFEPPIDPAMLVKAMAGGMDLSSALNDLNATLPNYRFSTVIEKAKEFVNVVKNTGNLLLSVLEKKDAEGLALLRADNEIKLLEVMEQIKRFQLDEAQQNRKALQENWNLANDKYDFYENCERWNTAEGFQVTLMGTGIGLQIVAEIINLASAGLSVIPQVDVGASGVAATPVATVHYGGQQFANAATAVARSLNDIAGTLYQGASLSGIIAGIQRRTEDWDFQSDQAEIEIKMIEHQIEAATTRWEIANAEITNHQKRVDQRKAEYEYMKSKFTNKDLYDWMTGQVSAVYFQAYQMAYDLAKRAERSFKYELADSEDSYISYGYWDSLKKGLLAGEKMHNDLMRMEAAYLEKNKRTYEITKHVSLSLINPFALMQLRETGKCYFDLPEEIFDVDHPGHYMRRIKSVNISIPCVAGPYTGVNAKLTLLKNSIRKKTDVDPEDPASYPQSIDESDDRFVENLAMIQSIATSSAQNDSGLFALDFRDERYLPFEGAGVISSWQLELPQDFRSFDYNTISDVVVSVNYTAKDGGGILKASAEGHLHGYFQNSSDAPLERLFSMKSEFANEWHRFLSPRENEEDQQLSITLKKIHFPYLFKKSNIQVQRLDFILQLKDPALYSSTDILSLSLSGPVSEEVAVPLNPASEEAFNSQPVNLDFAVPFNIEDEDVEFVLKAKEEDISSIPEALRIEKNGHVRLKREEIVNIFIIVHYYTES